MQLITIDNTMAQTSTEKCGIKAEIENKAVSVSVTSSIHLKRHSFKDLIISEENMSKLYRSSNTTNMPNNFSWVIPNILAGCAVPKYETDMNGLVDLGITKLITLSEKCLPSQQSLSQLGIKHEIHGCVEFEGIPVAKIVKIIESIENEIAADGKVAVHCRAGNGRTGTVLAAFIMKEKNLSSEEAIAFVRKLRRWSVETRGQENCLALYGHYLQDGIFHEAEADKTTRLQDDDWALFNSSFI